MEELNYIPRVVVVTRPTEYESLLIQHGTRGQADFFLKTRGKDIQDSFALHEVFKAREQEVLSQIPTRWRRARVNRVDLDRFIFEPDDLVITLGPDGLVPNTAKYLTGQTVIGINPHPDLFDGILCQHSPQQTQGLLELAAHRAGTVERRTMVEALLDDGQKLVALNEIYVGQRTHQSARYDIEYQNSKEFHSSSGLICVTGTGATGWGKSIHNAYQSPIKLPQPTDNKLAFFVREAFPSQITGTQITQGIVNKHSSLHISSRMDTDGVIFGDGIEQDYLPFLWGQKLTMQPAEQKLHLLVG